MPTSTGMTVEAEAEVVAMDRSVRMLVAIASYGDRNLTFLNAVVDRYRSMPMAVDVVVLSDRPKRMPPDVRVSVGLPSKNPWSLPFAHKALFAENADRYDLFLYSEDDIDVGPEHIGAFLHATSLLGPNEIAGFLRYERDAAGATWMCDAHSEFHWKPESVVRRGGEVFAEYTNAHSAFFILTRTQLRSAIASGGFLRPPYEGRYDMLCTAATDPYTSCGLRRLICVSGLDRFLVHHLSNRYAGRMGLPSSSFKQQVETVLKIACGTHPVTTLCEVESRLPGAEWSKTYDEKVNAIALELVPRAAKTVLSVGCGSGATEAALKQRGSQVTVLPLDSVVGAAASTIGLAPVYGTLDECLAQLHGQAFDAVLMSDVLHLQPHPEALFRQFLELVANEGTLVVVSPNFDRPRIWADRILSAEFRKLRNFAEGGVSVLRPGTLRRAARKAGFVTSTVRWDDHALPKRSGLAGVNVHLGRLSANHWVMQATRRARGVH